jgi:hypothetical protein
VSSRPHHYHRLSEMQPRQSTHTKTRQKSSESSGNARLTLTYKTAAGADCELAPQSTAPVPGILKKIYKLNKIKKPNKYHQFVCVSLYNFISYSLLRAIPAPSVVGRDQGRGSGPGGSFLVRRHRPAPRSISTSRKNPIQLL